MDAKGKLSVKEFVEVEMLNIFPAVPVAMEVITLGESPIVVEVPIITCLPSPEVKVKPEPRPMLPKVVVPRPPLATASNPVISVEPKFIAPLNKLPEAVERTGRAEVKELMVVEPLTVSLLIVVVARVDVAETFKFPKITWLPVVVALPLTVSCEIVVVARLDVPKTVRLAPSCSLPEILALPTTLKADEGEEEPIPKKPADDTVSNVEPLVDEIVNKSSGEEVATTLKRENGTLVPMPMLSPEINNVDCGVTLGVEAG